MIIRSQDKRILVNFNNVSSVCLNGANRSTIEAIYPATNESTCLCDALGVYSTEEKAIKVLDMIQRKNTLDQCKIMNVSYEAMYCKYVAEQEYDTFVMPQDDEVTV